MATEFVPPSERWSPHSRALVEWVAVCFVTLAFLLFLIDYYQEPEPPRPSIEAIVEKWEETAGFTRTTCRGVDYGFVHVWKCSAFDEGRWYRVECALSGCAVTGLLE